MKRQHREIVGAIILLVIFFSSFEIFPVIRQILEGFLFLFLFWFAYLFITEWVEMGK